VVLGRRVSVLLVALVLVVMALGIMGVLRAGSASPDTAAKERSSTLTVLTKTREARVVDLGPQGPTHGDMRVVNAPLYNESGKQRIGRLDLFCVVTDPADEPNEKAHMAQCTYIYTLPGGEISAQGVNAYPKLSEPAPRSVDALSGGTGKYAGVRGERRFETHGTKVIITFHFIG
jgi:predicted secreted Zn-dependent protease